MRSLWAVVAIAGAGSTCTPVHAQPRRATSSGTARPADAASDAIAQRLARFACARVVHPVAHFHRAELRLEPDGRFELNHTNVEPLGGERTLWRGTYRVAGQQLVLDVTQGQRHRWWGDGHRFSHGENVPYCEWFEPVRGGARTLVLAVAADGGEPRVRLEELRTQLAAVRDGTAPPPCDDAPPRIERGAVVGGAVYPCVTPPR